MAWTALTSADLLKQLSVAEHSALKAVQRTLSADLDDIVANAVAEMRDAIRSGGYELDTTDGTLPKGLHNYTVAIARWRLLLLLPKDESVQSKPRETAYDDAVKIRDRISQQDYYVEPPVATAKSAGNWNSENKIVGRTHPVPKPASQFPAGTNDYANPDAPPDAARE